MPANLASSATQGSHCPFCDIAQFEKDSRGQDVLYQDDEVYIIEDMSPHAPHHYLVVPKRHLKSVNTLTSAEHVDLVEHMSAKGQQFLRNKVTGEFNAEQLRIGFHYPPLISVEHLHLHVMYPAKDMYFFFRNFMFKYSRFFRKVDDVIDDLRKGSSVKDIESPAEKPATSPGANST